MTVPEGGSEDGRAERWNTLAVEVAQVVCDTKDPGIRGTMQDVLAMMADIEKRVPLRARTEAEPVKSLGYVVVAMNRGSGTAQLDTHEQARGRADRLNADMRTELQPFVYTVCAVVPTPPEGQL